MNGALRPPAGAELLDDLAADPDRVALSLQNIARSNRWFGGRSAVASALRKLLADARQGDRFTLLDVGTGLGDLPRAAVAWGERRGLVIQPFGLERHPAAARLAFAAGLPTLLGCGAALPLRSRSVDLITVSQVAHHLEAEVLAALLTECDRVARRGVIVTDLRRSRFAQAGFWIGAHLLRFDPDTRSDGLRSIRRGFSAPELIAALEGAGIRGHVWRHPMFRLVAAWQPVG
ncbi:MAG TPA: methyltransferase domain-containing protein [Gemmatimonadales bacterium]|nr:methyltransferase domain-containing protein [Gemmatimonadales bacterium]